MGVMASCWKPKLKAVDSVDVERMLGVWKVMAVIPTPMEKGGFNPTEVYTWDAKNKRIDVDFHMNKGSVDGPRKSIPQKIYTGGYPKSTGRWQASPVWPIKLGYIIMDLDPEYKWVVVGHPSRAYFWIMSRKLTLDQGILDAKIQLGKDEGFDTSKIEYPKHGGKDSEDAET